MLKGERKRGLLELCSQYSDSLLVTRRNGSKGKTSHFYNQQFFDFLILNKMQDKFHEHVNKAEFSTNMKHIIEGSTRKFKNQKFSLLHDR